MRNLMFLRVFLVVTAFLFSSNAFPQTSQNRPTRATSPGSPGGPAEGLVRVVTNKMAEALGQPIIIEAKPGANGTIGTAYVAKAAPDGYTILLSHLGPTAISPALQKDLPYDSLKDFEPITQVVAGPTLLGVRNDLPVRNGKER